MADEQEQKTELEPLVKVLKEALDATHLVMATGQSNPGARLIAAAIVTAGQLIASAVDDLCDSLEHLVRVVDVLDETVGKRGQEPH